MQKTWVGWQKYNRDHGKLVELVLYLRYKNEKYIPLLGGVGEKWIRKDAALSV